MGSSAEHTRLVGECLEELALMGFAAWPNTTGATEIDGRFVRFGKRGSGDILALLPTRIGGRVYGIHGEIEAKTGNAIQNKRQKCHMRVVRNSGGIYIVARTREDMKSQLAELGYGERGVNLESTGAALLL